MRMRMGTILIIFAIVVGTVLTYFGLLVFVMVMMMIVMVMAVTVTMTMASEESVRVSWSFMQYFIDGKVDKQICCGCDEHDKRFFYKFFVDDSVSWLDHNKDDESPYDKDVRQSS